MTDAPVSFLAYTADTYVLFLGYSGENILANSNKYQYLFCIGNRKSEIPSPPQYFS